jgi:hypothetical protein
LRRRRRGGRCRCRTPASSVSPAEGAGENDVDGAAGVVVPGETLSVVVPGDTSGVVVRKGVVSGESLGVGAATDAPGLPAEASPSCPKLMTGSRCSLIQAGSTC